MNLSTHSHGRLQAPPFPDTIAEEQIEREIERLVRAAMPHNDDRCAAPGAAAEPSANELRATDCRVTEQDLARMARLLDLGEAELREVFETSL